MTLADLQLFKDIARESSITRGAERNQISQSAASQRVLELERSLGLSLLDRTTRPLKLTSAGQAYFDFCRDVLQRKEDLDAALDRVRRDVEGAVRIASIYSIGLSEITRWEAEFSRLHPKSTLNVEFLRPDRVYDAVLDGAAELGLVSYPEPNREIATRAWREEVMLVAARPDHPLAVNTFLAPRELDGADFVGYDEDLPVGRALRRYFREHSVDVRTVMHFDNVLMIKEAVALGSGISILPETVLADDIAQDRLIGIPLESPGFYRPLGVIHRRRKRLGRAAQIFLEMLGRQPKAVPAAG